MELIPLNHNQFAIVDSKDFEGLSQYKWRADKYGNTGFRVLRTDYEGWKKGKQATIFMHRQIMNPPANMQIDHINHNALDNRRCNLRVCTQSQNMANGKMRSKKTSRYRGVHFDKLRKKWQAQIRSNGQNKGLGYFINEAEAAMAYDNEAWQSFGEFATLNFPQAISKAKPEKAAE